MPHVRTLIRSAAVATLTGLPATGANVFKGRTRPLAAAHPDLLLVYARETRSVYVQQGDPPERQHELQLFVEGRVSLAAADEDDDVSARLEERLDEIERQVNGALFALAAPDVKIHDIELRHSVMHAQASGERHQGEVRMEFSVQFFTPADDLSQFA